MHRRPHTVISLSRRLCIGVALLATMASLTACRSKSSKASSHVEGEPIPGVANLPSIVIKDDSVGLTFSYIMLDGGFKTVTKVADVPYEGRDAVRVWSDVSGDGVAGPYVYVADLRNKLADGSYKCDVFPRAYFDDLAVDRRKKNALGPTVGNAAADKAPEPNGGVDEATGALTVIIYGADWCKPCHAAEAFLKQKGVPYVHKDVDDPNVSEEMQVKLQAAGIQTQSIPVLDIAGKLLVGFEPSELDQAIREAKKK